MKVTRPRITSAHVIAFVALFAALGGTVYAASHINGRTIAKGSIPANRLKTNSVTGAQVNEDALANVPSATHAAEAAKATQATKANQAETSVNAQNAQNAKNAKKATEAETAVRASEANVARNAAELGGVAPSGYQRSCQTGAIEGKVTVTPLPAAQFGFSNEFDCAGGHVSLVRKVLGEYEVTFPGLNGTSAIAGATGLHGAAIAAGTGPTFLVKVFSTSKDELLGDERFTIVVF